MDNTNDRVVVITGGANGLGLAISRRFAQERFRVCVLDINVNAAEQHVETLNGQGLKAIAAYVDVANVSSIDSAFDYCVREYSRIDVLVCCAAVIYVEPFVDISSEAWDHTFAVNAKGLYFCVQKAARIMRRTGGGRIINISSPASRMGIPFYAVYAASKAAVDSITRSAAIALAEYNIRVNCLAPGRMDTDMQETSERTWAALAGFNYEEFVKNRTESLPLRRRVTVDEMAACVMFLANDASDYMTGSRLNISGGLELS